MMDFPGHVTCDTHFFYLVWSKITPLLKDLILFNLFFIYDDKYKVYGADWHFWKLFYVNYNVSISEGDWGE